MPNPKRRHSKARRDKRRAHDALTPPALSDCPNCHEAEAAAPRLPALRVLQGQAGDQHLEAWGQVSSFRFPVAAGLRDACGPETEKFRPDPL